MHNPWRIFYRKLCSLAYREEIKKNILEKHTELKFTGSKKEKKKKFTIKRKGWLDSIGWEMEQRKIYEKVLKPRI